MVAHYSRGKGRQSPLAADMPLNVQEALEAYLDCGNVSAVARSLGLPRITVQKWSERYQFRAIAEQFDADTVRDTLAHTRRRWALAIPAAVDTIIAASSDRIGNDGKPEPGSVTNAGLRASLALVDRSGALASLFAVDALPASSAAVASFDRIAALLAAGDTAALLALATGQDAAIADAAIPSGGAAPGDFVSANPGGRVVPGSYPDHPSESGDVIEAVFGQRGQPAPERHYHPNGEAYTEVDQS